MELPDANLSPSPSIKVRGRDRGLVSGQHGRQRQVIAYDGFAYSAGQPLDGQNGGMGWAGPWATSGGSVVVQSGSLAGSVAATGNSLAAGNASGGGNTSRSLAAPAGGNGATVWLSFLQSGPASLQSNSFTGIDFSPNATGILGFGIGAYSSSPINPPMYSIIYQGTGGASEIISQTSTSSSTLALLVARVQYGDSTHPDVIDLFVNPPIGGPAPATPDAMLSVQDLSGPLPAFNLIGVSAFSPGTPRRAPHRVDVRGRHAGGGARTRFARPGRVRGRRLGHILAAALGRRSMKTAGGV